MTGRVVIFIISSFTMTFHNSIPSETFMTRLVKLLYKCSCLDHVYIFSNEVKQVYRTHDPFHVYSEPYDGDIYYKIEFDFSDIEEKLTFGYDEKDEDDDAIDEKRRVNEIVQNLNNLVFPENYTVTLVNNCGINFDERGSNKTEIELDFNDTWKLKTNSVADLVEGLYRIKSHKFDYWYELFCDITMKITGNEIFLNFVFDHGS